MNGKRIRLGAMRAANSCRLGRLIPERWIRMENTRHAVLPILFEKGTDETVLVIAFSGNARKLDVPVHEFFETTKTLGYNRILLWDKYVMYYHYGVDRKRRNWPSLIAYLEQEIARLQPKRVFCVGTSSGGYAALVAGHHLRADFVHAFSPQTEIDLSREGVRGARHPVHRWRMSFSRRIHREVLDLAPMLSRFNGKTRYFVHYGSGNEIDCRFAGRIAEKPGVITLGYPCSAHAVAVFLAKKKFLGHVLLLRNQQRLEELARDHFGDSVRITSSAAIAQRQARSAGIVESNLPTM